MLKLPYNYAGAKAYTDAATMLVAMAYEAPEGDAAEFGVATGRTINLIADANKQHIVHGFDTFAGLPERWRTGFEAGAFSQGGKMPRVADNVKLYPGLFENTAHLALHGKQLGFVHIDCDLYSATVDALKAISGRLLPEAIIVFDEYWNYPGWHLHEAKAFAEWLETTTYQAECIAYNIEHEQVAFRIYGKA